MPPLFRSPAIFRAAINWWPPYWGTGISVAGVAADWMRMEVHLKERYYNRNAFGTHFGGSLYAMCDPHFALLLIPLLGADYVVWDKAATIEFIKPGRGVVRAVFNWTPDQLAEIRRKAAGGSKVEPERTVEVLDERGDVVARVHKTLHVRRRR